MYRLFIFLIVCSQLGFSSVGLAREDASAGNQRGFDWILHIGAATFLGRNSWFGQSEEFVGAETDNWSEAAIKLGFKGHTPLGRGSFFGGISGVFSKTWGDDASGLTVGLDQTHEADIELAFIGWRSGTTFSSLDTDALTIKAGNFDYLVGTGLQIADGTSDGALRGGWYLGWRSVFHRSVLATLQSGAWKAEGFYLQGEPREVPELIHAYGGNFEYTFEDIGLNTGLLYFKRVDQISSNSIHIPWAESLSVRGDWASTDKLGFAGEYLYQSRPGSHPVGWYLKAVYQWSDVAWMPQLSYRYAAFDGDNLSTSQDESFYVAAYGSTDYGTWVQGEITGNYPLGNSNLKSNMLRLKLFPRHNLVLNAIYYDFHLDQPNIVGEPVGSTDWGNEIDLTATWTAENHLILNATFGLLFPGEAASNWIGGDKTWLYFMLHASYKF
jgi:hypothetical protein